MSVEVLEFIDSPSTVEKPTINGNQEEKNDDKTIILLFKISSNKFRIWRNVTVLSLSFLLLLTACNVVSSLQSTINNADGLGTIAEASIDAAQIVSSLFIPTWIIKKIDLKWTMVISELFTASYIAVQFYPRFYTMIPAAILNGLGAAPLWISQSVYLTRLGEMYAELLGDPKSKEIHISRFFGVFFMIISTASIWGQLISSLVLSSEGDGSVIADERLSYCGVNFCPQEWLNYSTKHNDSEFKNDNSITTPARTDILIGILLGCALASAIVLAIFVDAPFKKTQTDKVDESESTLKSVMATFRHMKNPYMILLIPLTLWNGFKTTFIMAEFTYAFIYCALGVEQIGYILICVGSAGAIGALLAGFLVKIIGRWPIIILASLTNLVLIFILLYIWIPDPDHVEIFYILAAVSGLADSALLTQTTSFYAAIFPRNENAAFSNQRLWNSLAFATAFGYSTFLCVDVKLYVISGVLLSGVTGYILIESFEHKKSNIDKK